MASRGEQDRLARIPIIALARVGRGTNGNEGERERERERERENEQGGGGGKELGEGRIEIYRD